MRPATFIIFILSLVIVISFFLPWVDVKVSKVNESGVISAIASYEISGFSIPVIANSKDSLIVIILGVVFDIPAKEVKKNSKLLWCLPLLALIIACLTYLFPKSKPVYLSIAVIGAGIFFYGFYKIRFSDLDRVLVKVAIEWGLWILLYSFLLIGISAGLNYFSLAARKNK